MALGQKLLNWSARYLLYGPDREGVEWKLWKYWLAGLVGKWAIILICGLPSWHKAKKDMQKMEMRRQSIRRWY